MAEHAPTKNDLTSFIRDSLNEPQRAAVTNLQGPLLVVAGAGSGKTRVITARIAHLLIDHKQPASSILALTFTNKAAKEMQERITSFLPDDSIMPFIGTFHAYCLQLLKRHASLLDVPFSTILDADDQRAIIEGIIKRNGLQQTVTSRHVQHQISFNKNQCAIPENTHQWSRIDPLLAQLYTSYEHEKTLNKCLDFDDLLLHALKLFKRNEAFKQQFQATVRHILVDEYQDTNIVQHELLKQMTKHDNRLVVDSLCAVGDEDQSIYSWRGATVSNIINFNKDFPTTTTIKIEQNYRSVQQILDIANTIIDHNTQRTAKKLWSAKHATGRIRTITCSSEYQEADAIAAMIANITHISKSQSRAILYRAHFQSRALEEALIKHAIPYTIVGGVQFYERKEIKDLLAYLRLFCNQFDRVSFFRAVNCPPRGLGDKFVELVHEQWSLEPHLPFPDIIRHLIGKHQLSGARAESIQQFMHIFQTFTSESSPSKALEHILKVTHYITYLNKQHDPNEAKERIENVQELIRAVHHTESQGTVTIAGFLDEVTLIQEKHDANDITTNPVFLMTLHAAKGLEFDTVILAGLEEGILPSSRSINNQESLEEERRLLYVGITRARERLLLSHCRHRYTYGNLTNQYISRFLEEIPPHLVPSYNLAMMNPMEIRIFFDEWFGKASTHIIRPTITTPSVTKHLKPMHQTKQPVNNLTTTLWKKNQLVVHETFGVGMILDVEERGSNGSFATVKFKRATKKISTRFLQVTRS